MDDSAVGPDSLEKIFLKIEQETERRAVETDLTQHEHVEAIGCSSSVQKGVSVVSGKRVKDRERGSISFSRIGQVSEDNLSSGAHLAPAQPVSSPTQPGFYEKARTKNDSIESIVSMTGTFPEPHNEEDIEDNTHVTQMQHIAGRPGISSTMLLRRLSRSYSGSVIPTMGAESNLMVGVSVEEATTESISEDGIEVTISRRSSVQASGRLPSLRSPKSSASGSNLLPKNWILKVKDLMQKGRLRKPT